MARAGADLVTLETSNQKNDFISRRLGNAEFLTVRLVSNAEHGFAECTERLTVCDHIYQPASGAEAALLLGLR